MSVDKIFNVIRLSDQIVTAGQPTEEQLQSLAEEGFNVVINLATIDPRYSLDDEATTCAEFGMTYHHIPVEWDAPKVTDYADFKKVMSESGDQKLLIHCAANYRVTAFYSVYAKQTLGWTEQQAVELRQQIWESNPDWSMDDVWKEYIKLIDD